MMSSRRDSSPLADLRIGRRGTFLLLFGAVYLTYGVTLTFHPSPAYAVPGPEWLPGMVFTVAGLTALFSGLAHPRTEWLGFTCLEAAAGAYAASYILSGIDGEPRWWAGLLIWTLVVGVVLLIAGWAEPPPEGAVRRAADAADPNGHVDAPQRDGVVQDGGE